jgi:hypothetical protein
VTEAEELELLELEAEEARARGQGAVKPDGGVMPRPDPSLGEAVGRAGVQGATAGFGDEINAAVQAGPMNPMANPLAGLAQAFSDVPESQQKLARQVDVDKDAINAQQPGGRLRALLQDYRLNRDADRAGNARAKEAHPGACLATEIAAGVPLAFALPGGQATSVGGMAGAGALAGGLGGLGGSDADLTKGDVGGALWDTGVGATLGAALGAGASYLPKVAKAAAGKGAELLERLGIGQGRKVLTGGTKSISQAAAVSDDAVRRALEEGAIRPLGTTAGAAERLGVLREGAGEQYAQIVQALEEAGVHGPQRDALARQLFQEAQGAAANTAGSSVPGYLNGIAQDVAGLPGRQIPGELAPVAGEVGETIGQPVERLGLQQAENVKRSLQDAARREYTKVGGNTELGEAKMAAAARLRQAVEDAVAEQAGKAPAQAAAFEPVKKRLSELISGSNAAEKALNAAKNKNAVSLRDLLVMGAGKDAGQKLALLPLSMAARATGPSTVAAGSYGMGSALRRLMGLSLPKTGRDILTATERAALNAYLENPNGP